MKTYLWLFLFLISVSLATTNASAQATDPVAGVKMQFMKRNASNARIWNLFMTYLSADATYPGFTEGAVEQLACNITLPEHRNPNGALLPATSEYLLLNESFYNPVTSLYYMVTVNISDTDAASGHNRSMHIVSFQTDTDADGNVINTRCRREKSLQNIGALDDGGSPLSDNADAFRVRSISGLTDNTGISGFVRLVDQNQQSLMGESLGAACTARKTLTQPLP